MDIINVRVDLVLSKTQALSLAGKSGALRENPRKTWSDKELKEHIRLAVKKLVAKENSWMEYAK